MQWSTLNMQALLSVREWNGDSFVLLAAVWIFTSLSKDQRSQETQVSLRLNILLFRTGLIYAQNFLSKAIIDKPKIELYWQDFIVSMSKCWGKTCQMCLVDLDNNSKFILWCEKTPYWKWLTCGGNAHWKWLKIALIQELNWLTTPYCSYWKGTKVRGHTEYADIYYFFRAFKSVHSIINRLSHWINVSHWNHVFNYSL